MYLRCLKKLLWIPIAMVALVSAQEAKRPMTVDDALDMIQVSGPQISPDGKWILYSRSDSSGKTTSANPGFS